MILITGHKGLLGSHLMKAFGNQGAIGLEKTQTFAEWRERLRELWTTYYPEVIVHAGAVSDNQYTNLDIFQWNVYATQAIVEIAASGEAPFLIYISSQTANAPTTLYGHTKAISELLVESVGACVFQPFNIYAADERMKPAHCQSLPHRLKAQNLEVLWETCRDYIHIDDVVRAIVSVIKQHRSGVYHLGTGVGTQSNDLAALCEWKGYRREPRPVHIEYGNIAEPERFLPDWEPNEVLSSRFFE